jgi:hypothetical protein
MHKLHLSEVWNPKLTGNVERVIHILLVDKHHFESNPEVRSFNNDSRRQTITNVTRVLQVNFQTSSKICDMLPQSWRGSLKILKREKSK